jgi:hypothetical protein
MNKTEISKEVLHEYHKQHTAAPQLDCIKRELQATRKRKKECQEYPYGYMMRLRKRAAEIKNNYFITPCASQG